MTNSPAIESQLVRFEEVTPTNRVVAYFRTELVDLFAGTGLPIFSGYDGLGELHFVFVTLPSRITVVLGQYDNAPEVGVNLYMEIDRTRDIAPNVPALVVEACQYLSIPREMMAWFHHDYEVEIDRLLNTTQTATITKSVLEVSSHSKEYEPIDCFYHALEIYTREQSPEHWAMLQHNLGLSYYYRTAGERWENLQWSIMCFNRSLEVFDRDKYPQKWKINQEDLQQSQKAQISTIESLSSIVYKKRPVTSAVTGGSAAPAEAVEDKTEFDVILESVPDDKKISVLKVVRGLNGLGLKEAKDLVEASPQPVREGVAKDAAEYAKKQIEEAGGKVTIR